MQTGQVPPSVTDQDPGAPQRRPSWRSGSSTAAPWNVQLILIAIIGLGAGVALSSYAATSMVNGEWLSRTALWAGLAVPVLIAFARSRPRGLLGFKKRDLLYGLALGLVLRMIEGWLTIAAGGAAGFPTLPLGGGWSSPDVWFSFALAPIVIAPLVEEFFFRAVILVSIVVMLREKYRRGRALFAASVISTALFVLTHTVTAASTWDAAVSLLLLGAICAALVATTGRIWGAIIVHVSYNALYALLALIGTVASTVTLP